MTLRAGIAVELCRVETAEGRLLDGALYGAAAIESAVTFIVVHGTGGNFYSPGPLETFSLLAARTGHAAVRINTQGHDQMANIPGPGGSILGGAAFERPSDGGKDVAAWACHFSARGANRLILVGHSMGGLKSLLAAQDLASERIVEGVVCFSPPWLNYEHWMSHPSARSFRETMAAAEEAVRRGEGDALIRCRQPVSIITTAAGFCEKYGPASGLDLMQILPQIDSPVLVTFGERTIGSSPAFDQVSNELERLQKTRKSLELQIIPGETMGYSGQPDCLFRRTLEWLERTGISA